MHPQPKRKTKTNRCEREEHPDKQGGPEAATPPTTPQSASSSIKSCNDLTMKMEFMGERIKWQERLIKDLEEERTFLREQLAGSRAPGKAPEEPSREDNVAHESATLSSSSSSDGPPVHNPPPKKKRHHSRGHSSHHMRVRTPRKVIERYQEVLRTFKKVRTMTEAFNRQHVDRGTIVATAPIAELEAADPRLYGSLIYDSKIETLLGFAKRCGSSVTPDLKAKIADLKARGVLLPINVKY
ncbi:coiled-coil domain-containing protein 106-like [Engraulis encrasicolus]|uniref:coiled-coil domain-containing protein 106-like n=1 Tax=Engraulis encrasicolus TaxID=184585 RepID=UPI002FD0AEDE